MLFNTKSNSSELSTKSPTGIGIAVDLGIGAAMNIGIGADIGAGIGADIRF